MDSEAEPQATEAVEEESQGDRDIVTKGSGAANIIGSAKREDRGSVLASSFS